MPQSKYDSYDGSDSSSGGDGDDEEIKFSPFTSIAGTPERLFGTDNDWGHTVGLVLNDVVLTDGALYYDADNDKYKLFSHADAAGMSPADASERGMDLTLDNYDEVITKSYFGDSYTYDLVAFRVEETDTGAVREVTQTDDGLEFSGFEETGDEVPITESTITWFGGADEPSPKSIRVAEVLSEYGESLTNEDADIYNWLNDTSGDNILRSDVSGREIEVVMTQRDGENYNYNWPVVVDRELGEELSPNNSGSTTPSGGESGGSDGGNAAPQGYSEDVADFIQSASNLELTPDRANELLDDMLADSDAAITEEAVEEAGGRGVVIEEVV